MSNPLIPTKLPYVDENNKIEDVVNYMAKTINGATTKRISDSIEKTISDSFPVGTIMHSLLTEAQFQAQMGVGWVLMNGRSISGSTLSSLTGAATIPDATGRFLRGKGTNNPDGSLALGARTAAKTKAVIPTCPEAYGAGSTFAYISTSVANSATVSNVSNGDNQTAPDNITVNIFIKIN